PLFELNFLMNLFHATITEDRREVMFWSLTGALIENTPANLPGLFAACNRASPPPVEKPPIARQGTLFFIIIYALPTESYHFSQFRVARSSGAVPWPRSRGAYKLKPFL